MPACKDFVLLFATKPSAIKKKSPRSVKWDMGREEPRDLAMYEWHQSFSLRCCIRGAGAEEILQNAYWKFVSTKTQAVHSEASLFHFLEIWIILLSHLTVSKMPSLLVVSRGLSLNFLKQGVLPFMAGPDRGAALTNLTNQSGLYWFYKWKLSPSQVK